MEKTKVAKKRHLLKAITWRVIASLTSFFIGWAATGDISMGLTVGAFDVVIKFVLYYLHERAWYRSDYGVEREKNQK